MKAIMYEQYGGPEVLQLKDVEKPTPQDNEVLIEVRASAANPLDWHFMRGSPRFARLSMGLTKPKSMKLGADVAGQVVAVGRNIRHFQPGDKVYGELSRLGAFAEYACGLENELAKKPFNLSYEEAAAVPLAGLTAFQGLKYGKIRAGQKVLINGASGGVGTFAVQLAKALGAAEVTGVCSTRNLEMVKEIGADHAVDYTQEDFTRQGKQYDLIFDAVGNRNVQDLRRAVAPGGRCVIAGFTSASLLLQHGIIGGLVSATSSKKIGMMPVATPNREDLEQLKKLIEEGLVRPVIHRKYELPDTAEAIAHLETGHTRGKVVILI